MPDWLLDRRLIIGLAVFGGICSLLATWFQSPARSSSQIGFWLGKASYAFMSVSIVLFICAGFFASQD